MCGLSNASKFNIFSVIIAIGGFAFKKAALEVRFMNISNFCADFGLLQDKSARLAVLNASRLMT